MAILVQGCNPKNEKNCMLFWRSHYDTIFVISDDRGRVSCTESKWIIPRALATYASRTNNAPTAPSSKRAQATSTSEKCPGILDVCCKDPNFFTPPTRPTVKYKPKCGYRNLNCLTALMSAILSGASDWSILLILCSDWSILLILYSDWSILLRACTQMTTSA